MEEQGEEGHDIATATGHNGGAKGSGRFARSRTDRGGREERGGSRGSCGSGSGGGSVRVCGWWGDKGGGWVGPVGQGPGGQWGFLFFLLNSICFFSYF